MNIFKKNKRSFIIVIILILLSGSVMAGFFSKELNKSEFLELLTETKREGEDTLKNFDIKDIEFPVNELRDITFKNTTWKNIDAHKRSLINITFKDCRLENINFSYMEFGDLSFINCELRNVVTNNSKIGKLTVRDSHIYNTDTNGRNNWEYLEADTIEIINSKINDYESDDYLYTDISFFESKADFIIKGSELKSFGGMGLKKGSSLEIYDSKIKDMDFSSSYLDHLIVKNSIIKKSKINDSHIKTITLENNKFYRFPVTNVKEGQIVYARNNNDLTVSGKISEMQISDCTGKIGDISIIEANFDLVNIRNCQIDEFIAFYMKGKKLVLENVHVNKFDFGYSKVDELILKNITINKYINTEHAQVDNYKSDNVQVKTGIKRRTGGENITIKSTP